MISSMQDRTKWIVSTVSVLLIIISLCCILLAYFIVEIEKSFIEINDVMLSSFSSDVDSKLLELQLFASSFVNDEMLEDENISNTEMNNLADSLGRYKDVNPNASAIYVYLPEKDVVFGDLGYFSMKNYYALMNGLSMDGIERFREELLGFKGSGYDVLAGNLCYIREIRNRISTLGYLVVKVNLDNMISTEVSRTNVFYICVNGSIIASTSDNNTEIPSDFVIEDFSRYNNISYYNAFSDNPGLSKLKMAKALTAIIILICLLFGVAATMHIGKRRARIMNKLADKLSASPSYADMSDKIDALLRNSNISAQKLLEQQKILSSMFLSFVIRNGIETEQKVRFLAEKYGFEILSPKFRIGIIPSSIEIKEDLEDVVVTHEGNNTIFLIGIEDDESRAEEILSVYSDTYSIGGAYDSLSLIVRSYNEALRDNDPINKEPEPSIPVFIELFKQKEYEKSIVIITKILEKDNSKNEDELELRYAGVVRFIIKNADKKLNYEDFDFLSSSELSYSIARAIRLIDESSSLEITEQAKKIILREYTSPTFSVYSLADDLNVSNSYLSSIFKKKYGIGIAKYIASLRIEEAKNLIMSTNLPIKDIALRVGFSSDITFLRAFKRLESVTPGSLRKESIV